MIRWALLLLPFCVVITALEEMDEIPWAMAHLGMDLDNEPTHFNHEAVPDEFDEDMFEFLVNSHPFHSQDRRQRQDKIRNSKKVWRQRKVKPHALPITPVRKP